MQTTAKTHRRRAYRTPAAKSSIRLDMQDAMGNQRRVAADLVDVIEGGLGLALTTRVESGAIVVVRGNLGENRTADQLKAVVRWCSGRTDGTNDSCNSLIAFQTLHSRQAVRSRQTS